jgi:hypothetical protein
MPSGWEWGSGPEERARKERWEAQQRDKGKNPDKGGCMVALPRVAVLTAAVLVVRVYLLVPERVRYRVCRAVGRTKPTARDALALLERGELGAFRAGVSDWDHGGMP